MAGVSEAGLAGVEQRAVRVTLAAGSAHAAIEPVVVQPPEIAGAPGPRVADEGVVLVDAVPIRLRLDRFDAVHLILVETTGGGTCRTRVSL